MRDFVYFPIIKTRDAELKAYYNLNQHVKNKILPVFELTKSRKTKTAPDGDIHKKMGEIKKVVGNNPFILDLSTNEKYMNPQIETLLDPSNGYYEWVYFLNSYSYLNVIPMVHLYDDEDFTDVELFLKADLIVGKDLAVRIPYNIDNIDRYLSPILRGIKENNLYVIVDVGQIIDPIEDIEFLVKKRIAEVLKCKSNKTNIIVTSTSFPKTVKKYGEKNGEFPILEEALFKRVNAENNILYGDYASINIEQIEIKGGTFIPRIDISLDEIFFYERHKRNEGSYPLCAKNISKNTRYKSLSSWADEEISIAALNAPTGISPSFWIAVRMNYYMTKRVQLRELK